MNVNGDSFEGEVELAGPTESEKGVGLIYWRPDTTSFSTLIIESLSKPLCNPRSPILEDVVIHYSDDEPVLVEADPGVDFHRTMTTFQFECLQSKVRWVRTIAPKYCSWVYFSGKQYEFLTSNMTKSLNSCLWVARKLSIIVLIEKTRKKLANYFFKRNGEGLQMTGSVMPWVLSVLQELNDKSCQMMVQDFGLFRCLVHTPVLVPYDVDLEGRTCSCWRWQITGIPCSHTLAVSDSYREKHIAIRTTTLKISGLHTRKFSFQLSMLTGALSLSRKLS